MELEKALFNLHNAHIKQKQLQKRNNLIGIPIGLALGLVIAVIDIIFSFGTDHSLLVFSALLLTLPLQIILHELGHLVFGLCSNYRFVSFRVFVFAVYKKEGKLCFGRYSVPGTMGQCLMCPTKSDDAMPYRALLWGGVLMNSISALLSLPLFILCYNSRSLFGCLFFLGSIFWGIILALMNGISHKSGTVATDGYHARTLSKNQTDRTLFFNQLRISAAMTEGKRLCDMPKEWFTLPETASLDPLFANLPLMNAERNMEMGDFDTAEDSLLSLAARGEAFTEAQISAILSEYLYLEMIGKHRLEVVEPLRRALARYLNLTQNSMTSLRIQITYHYLFTGDLEAITKLQNKFNSRAKRFLFTGEIARERTLLAHPEELYQNWRSAPQS